VATYHYRRKLERADELKAVGAAVGAAAGVALVAWYFARIFIQRTPLLSPRTAGDDAAEPPRRVSGAMLRAALGPAAGD
jgi:hypothetical protein